MSVLKDSQDGSDGLPPSATPEDGPSTDATAFRSNPSVAAPFLVDGAAAEPARRFPSFERPAPPLSSRLMINLARLAVLGGVVAAVYLAQRSAPEPTGVLANPAVAVEESSPAETQNPENSPSAASAEVPGPSGPSGAQRASGSTFESAVSSGSADVGSASRPDQIDRTAERGAFGAAGTGPDAVTAGTDASDSSPAAGGDGSEGADSSSTTASTESSNSGGTSTPAGSSTSTGPSDTSVTTTSNTTTAAPATTSTTPPTTVVTEPPATSPRTNPPTDPPPTTMRPTTTRPPTTAPPPVPPRPPDACEVQTQNDGSRGVEIKYRNQLDFAPRFNLYRSDGSWLTDTSQLNEDVGDRVFDNGFYEREWPLYLNEGRGFEPRDVYYVVAVDAEGLVSDVIVCSRVRL